MTPETLDPKVMAVLAALLPIVMGGIKYVVKKWVPDSVIVEIKNEWIPFLLPVLGILGDAIRADHLDATTVTQGLVAGLAAVGVHQAARAAGLPASQPKEPVAAPEKS